MICRLLSPNFQIKGPPGLIIKLSLPHTSSAVWRNSVLLPTPYSDHMVHEGHEMRKEPNL